MPHQHVRFPNANGQMLAGILDTLDESPRAYALFAHCFTGSKNLKATAHISRALTESDIAVLRFDFTGLGESEGVFADTTFSNNVGDLIAAAAWLEREYHAPALLVGHSLGGTAMLKAAARIPSATAVATIGSPSHPAHVIGRFDDAVAEIEARGEAKVDLGGRVFTIKRQFLEDLDDHPLPDSIAGLGKALLVMHSPSDEIVGLDNASELYTSAKHPKSFISLDGADHLLTHEEDSRYAGRVLAAWADKYLSGGDAAHRLLAAEPGEVVARTGAGAFKTELNVAGHRWVADEPETHGGGNLGPTPYDLLSAALASCTSMTLRLYAEKRKLDLTATTVRVRHARVHAEDCENCASGEERIDEFRRAVALEGDLTEPEKKRLLEIADRCPVHKTLEGTIRIRTTRADTRG